MPDYCTVILDLFLLLGGFVLLIGGADWLVRGAASFARKYNVSELAIGLTIVAFGTSAPELIVNVIATWERHPEVVFGNIIGSNIFNLFLILGIAALIRPLAVATRTVRREIPMSLLAVVLMMVLVNDSILWGGATILTRSDALILAALFVAFLLYVFAGRRNVLPDTNHQKPKPLWLTVSLIVVGLGGLVLGGKLVVDSAVSIATDLNVSEKLIGLTIVAAGTSLPELATSAVAAFRRKADIAIGNIVGSNIFNIFFILSISGLVRPVAYDPVLNTDVIVLIGGTIFVFACMFIGNKMKLDRWQAALLCVVFVAYIAFLVVRK